MTDKVLDSLDRLRASVKSHGKVVVGFSGGADSALLAFVANETLGANARAITAVSPSLAPEELDDCRRLADEWDLEWSTVSTTELDDPEYRANDGMRCARCKDALMNALAPVAHGATVLLGVNLDDLGDWRPGQDAAANRGAVFPFVEAGIDKSTVRSISRHLGLRTWDKPAAACLASRVPYGTPVELTVLTGVARAESALKELGFSALRVRHYGDTARLEVPLDQFDAVLAMRDAIVAGVKASGYDYVTLDLEGLRSGNLNKALAK